MKKAMKGLLIIVVGILVSFVSAYLYSALQIETQSLLLKFSFTGGIALGMLLIALGIIMIQRAKS